MVRLDLQSLHPTLQVPLRLSAKAGEVTLICGASGRGKSTLLAQIWGSRPLSEGGKLTLSIDTETVDLAGLSVAALAHLRPKLMSYVEQSPAVLKRDVLASWFTSSERGLSEAMAAFDLDPALLARRAGEVSGGERQRFVLLRAILGLRPIVLLDEPFTGLDPARVAAVGKLLTNEAAKGRLILLSGHKEYRFSNHVLRV